MSQKNRITAVVFSMIAVAVMLFASCFIAVESGHECAGEDCSICCQMNLCSISVRSAVIHTIRAVTVSMTVFAAAASIHYAGADTAEVSPVTLKVKLLD